MDIMSCSGNTEFVFVGQDLPPGFETHLVQRLPATPDGARPKQDIVGRRARPFPIWAMPTAQDYIIIQGYLRRFLRYTAEGSKALFCATEFFAADQVGVLQTPLRRRVRRPFLVTPRPRAELRQKDPPQEEESAKKEESSESRREKEVDAVLSAGRTAMVSGHIVRPGPKYDPRTGPPPGFEPVQVQDPDIVEEGDLGNYPGALWQQLAITDHKRLILISVKRTTGSKDLTTTLNGRGASSGRSL